MDFLTTVRGTEYNDFQKSYILETVTCIYKATRAAADARKELLDCRDLHTGVAPILSLTFVSNRRALSIAFMTTFQFFGKYFPSLGLLVLSLQSPGNDANILMVKRSGPAIVTLSEAYFSIGLHVVALAFIFDLCVLPSLSGLFVIALATVTAFKDLTASTVICSLAFSHFLVAEPV